MDRPLISVGMPVFNAGKFLGPALSSIINQTYSNWELILIDDGSTDGCFENLSELSDSRIRLIKDGKNKGIAARLNEAIDLAKGEFFARMDSDDISYPKRFELQLNELQGRSDLDLLATRAVSINLHNKIVGELPFRLTHAEICARPWVGFYLPHPTWMGRIEWFREHRYASPGPYFCEDQELLLRTYKVSQFKCVDQILLHYRVRDKINLEKSIKTRWAVLKCQSRFFKSHGLLFSLLAVASFAYRLLKDLFCKMTESIK